MLLHELAHIRRGDLWVAAAQRLLGIAFFFHPVVWLANWLINEQREFACDEDALTASRADPRECGDGFLTVVEWAQDRETGAAATLAMFAPKSVIRRRLMRILNHDRRSRAGRVWTTSCVLATALFVLPSARAHAEVAPVRQPHISSSSLRTQIILAWPSCAASLPNCAVRMQRCRRSWSKLEKRIATRRHHAWVVPTTNRRQPEQRLAVGQPVGQGHQQMARCATSVDGRSGGVSSVGGVIHLRR